MTPRSFRFLAVILLLSVGGWLAAQGSVAPPRGPLRYIKGFPGSHLDYENLDLLIDVLQHVDQNYVHELTKEEKREFIEKAIEAGLEALDEHSGFLNRQSYSSFKKQNEGQFGGIGINLNLNRDTKRLTIVSPIVGSPAYKAGVKPGDIIEKVNGESTEGWSADDAVGKITGRIGEPVTLTLRARGSRRTREVTLVRALIEVESVLGDQRDAQQQWDFMLDKSERLGYIRLAAFGRKSADELRAALLKLKDKGVQGLVLDLRGNPGGSLTAAVDVVNLFVGEGRIVSVEGRARRPEIYDANPRQVVFPTELPLVVLVDRFSASASEIVAAALQDSGRAVVLGERTFGKGSVQNLIELENGRSAVKVTTAKYLRPSGKNIHRFPNSKDEDEWGVRPNEEVSLPAGEEVEYFIARRDRDIVRTTPTAEEQQESLTEAVESFAGMGLAASPFGPLPNLLNQAAAFDRLPSAPVPFRDRVLDRALEVLREQKRAAQPAALRQS